MGRCNCEAVNAGTPLAQNAEDHYFTWAEQVDYLNHNAPLIVGNQCPECLDEVAQGLICFPGDIVDTCVMASGEVHCNSTNMLCPCQSHVCFMLFIKCLRFVAMFMQCKQFSMCNESDTRLNACVVLLQELTDEIAKARVHASMEVVPVVTAATAPEVSVDIDAVEAALREANLKVVHTWFNNNMRLELSQPQLVHVQGCSGLTAEDVSTPRCDQQS
jgi:hypothetical protein